MKILIIIIFSFICNLSFAHDNYALDKEEKHKHKHKEDNL